MSHLDTLLNIYPEVREISLRTSASVDLQNQDVGFTPEQVRAETEALMWLRSADGKMMAISKGFSKHFGVSQTLEGKTQTEACNPSAFEHDSSDATLLHTPMRSAMLRRWWVRPDGVEESGVVLKRSQYVDGVLCIFGMILRCTISATGGAYGQDTRTD